MEPDDEKFYTRALGDCPCCSHRLQHVPREPFWRGTQRNRWLLECPNCSNVLCGELIGPEPHFRWELA